MQTYGDWNYRPQPFVMPTEPAAAIAKEMLRYRAHRQGTESHQIACDKGKIIASYFHTYYN